MSFLPKYDKSGRPLPWKWAILLLVNTVCLFGFYCYFVMARNINWIFWLYYGALAAVALGYILYNRGFSRRGLTLSDLPSDWPHEKKESFLRDRDERLARSKWMLTLLVPLCITVMFDVIYLFYGEMIERVLGDVLDFLSR